MLLDLNPLLAVLVTYGVLQSQFCALVKTQFCQIVWTCYANSYWFMSFNDKLVKLVKHLLSLSLTKVGLNDAPVEVPRKSSS